MQTTAEHLEVLPYHIMLIKDTALHLNMYPLLNPRAKVISVFQIQLSHPLAATIMLSEEESEGITDTKQVGTTLDKHTPLPTRTEEV